MDDEDDDGGGSGVFQLETLLQEVETIPQQLSQLFLSKPYYTTEEQEANEVDDSLQTILEEEEEFLEEQVYVEEEEEEITYTFLDHQDVMYDYAVSPAYEEQDNNQVYFLVIEQDEYLEVLKNAINPIPIAEQIVNELLVKSLGKMALVGLRDL